MADALARELDKHVSLTRRLTNKVTEHKEALKGAGKQFAGGVFAVLGGAAAAFADVQFGSSTPSGIPELTIGGTIPLVALGAAVAKVGAVAMHVMEKDSGHLGATLLGAAADGLAGGVAALTTARILLEMKNSSGAAPASS